MASESDEGGGEESAAHILRVLQEILTHGAGIKHTQGIDENESEATVNALTGPKRVYTGKKTDENDFIIDSGKVPLEKYNESARKAIKFIRERRDAKIAREAEEELNESLAASRSVAGLIARVDPLGLGAIRNSLLNPKSKLADMFIESRFKNLEDFLVRFEELQRGIKMREPNLKDKGDIGRSEAEFDSRLQTRIDHLKRDILAEFATVDHEGHLLRGKNPRKPSCVPPSSDDDEAGTEGEEGEESGGTEGGSAAKKRLKRKGGPDSPGTPVVLRRAVAIAEGRRAIVMQMVDAIDRINKLVGLVEVKRNLARLIVAAIVRVNDTNLFGLHKNIFLFGQPGTGKTTIAEKIGDLFRAMGIVPEVPRSGVRMISYDRSSLVAAFEGQTSIKTRQAFAAAYGGILFIDEVYTLYEGDRDETGREAVDTLVKFTEDFKGEVIIIGAGYEDLIRGRLFRANQGLSSRFPYKFRLPNYTAEQLVFLTVPNPDLSISQQLFSTYMPLYKQSGMRLTTLPVGVPYCPTKGSIVGEACEILTELIGRAWEKNLFEDTNARGALNLRRTIDEVRAFRLFNESNEGAEINPCLPAIPRDIYTAFVTWCETEKDLRVLFLDPKTQAKIESNKD
jgi:hypothetical protein